MNLLGGTFFFGEVALLRSASSLRSLCGLFWGSSCCGSTATAVIRSFCHLGLVNLQGFVCACKGKGEKEDEEEQLLDVGRCMKEEESSIE